MISFRNLGMAFFVFFPFLGVVPGIDVQPNFVFLAVLVLMFSFRYVAVPVRMFSLVLLFIFLCLMRVFLSFHEAPLSHYASFLASLVTPLLVWLLVRSGLISIDFKCFVGFSFIYLLVGVVQFSFDPAFLSFLVQRDNIDLLLESGRGVRSLTPEPSTFGRVLLIINIIYMFFVMRRPGALFSIQLILFSLFLIFTSFILSNSFYAVSFHLMFLVALMLCLYFKLTMIFIAVSLLFFPAVIYFIVNNSMGEGRFYYILNALVNDFGVIVNQGAFARVMNIPISLYGGLAHGPFGAGLGSRVVDGSFYIMGYQYDFIVGNRNLGGFIEFFLRLGVLSLPLFFWYFFMLFRIAGFSSVYRGRRYRVGLVFAWALFLISFFDGSPSNPLVWFAIFYIYFYIKEQRQVRARPGENVA